MVETNLKERGDMMLTIRSMYEYTDLFEDQPIDPEIEQLIEQELNDYESPQMEKAVA